MADAWRKIAGRGVLGDMNWGASFDTEIERRRKLILAEQGNTT